MPDFTVNIGTSHYNVHRISHVLFYFFSQTSDLLLEATECLLLPKRKSQIHSHRVAPRRPTSVNHVMYAIGGMSRREASKSGEKYDPRERKWKTIGKNILPSLKLTDYHLFFGNFLGTGLLLLIKLCLTYSVGVKIIWDISCLLNEWILGHVSGIPIDFVGVDDIITNLEKEREPGDSLIFDY